MELSTIGQIATRVRDIDRAVTFYRDVLGVPFAFQVPNMAFFRCGTISLMLGLAEDLEHDHAGSVLYFDVPDIAAAHESLTRRGVKFVDQPHLVHTVPGRELWMTFFHDPDDNLLALMSWRALPV